MSISSAEWLSSCPRETKITGLLLPGTHDTMTAPCPQRYYHTQTLTLEEQLETGVRFLDIRLRREMVAAHREWISTISANDIFDTCGEFLEKHPGEFILMRVQNANEQKDDYPEYGMALQEKIAKYGNLFYHWEEGASGWMTLEEAAGRVVALECAPPEYGFSTIGDDKWAENWHDNPAVSLEDLWDGPGVDEKAAAIEEQLQKANELNDKVLSLAHISATNGKPGFPDAYAKKLNPCSLKILQRARTPRGVLIYDFITPSICQEVIKYDFTEG